jgi:hypothetical protein
MMKPFINLITMFVGACLTAACLATNFPRVNENSLAKKGDLYYFTAIP